MRGLDSALLELRVTVLGLSKEGGKSVQTSERAQSLRRPEGGFCGVS